MNINLAQQKAIFKEGLIFGEGNPTWSQTKDGYVYATKIKEDFVELYMFSPTGNRYKETREFGNEGWDVTGWSEDD